MNKDILIISSTSVVSGAEYVLGDYIENTKNKKYINILSSDIDIVTNYYNKFDINKHYKSKFLNPVGGIKKGKLNLMKKLFYLKLSFFSFLKIISNKKINIVLGNNTGDIVYSFYSFLFRKKHINYIHDIVLRDSLLAKMIKVFDRFINNYIAVSLAVKKQLIELGIEENKIILIYNGFDINHIPLNKKIEQDYHFGFVGNIEDRKDPLSFLNFINTISNCIENKVFASMVFGSVVDNKLFEDLKKTITDNKLDVNLIGKLNRDKMDNFYYSLNYLVVCSKNDPLPTVILEAFKNKTPVIGHNIDGIPEIIDDNVNGFLYNSKDDFKIIADKLKNSSEEKLGENALNTLQNKFSLNHKINHLDRILFNELYCSY